MPKRLCSYSGCGVITTTSRCSKHAITKTEERKQYLRSKDDRPSATKRGYNYDWRKARLSFLKRNPLCVHCLKQGVSREASEVDHITAHRGDNQLFWDVNNWQPLCKSCHSKKTNAEKKLYKGTRWWDDSIRG